MAQQAINRLNHDAVLSAEDYTAYQANLENEIITRFQIGSGFPNQTAQFGIIDAANPALLTASETTRPLFVSVSTVNALTVSVNAGYAVAPNGTLLNLAAFQQTVALADLPQTGSSYVIVVDALLNVTDGTTQPDDYLVVQSSQQTLSAEISSILYTAGWQPDPTQVPLAVVTVVSADGITQTLQIDQTANTYSFVRPWFSVVDTIHRASLGSGTVTTKNPHATSINDLTVPGTVGVFQGLTEQGMFVSQDRLRNKMLGAVVCNDEIDYAHILTDSSGTVTVGSPYSKAGAQYAYLSKFPTRLGSVCDSSSPANAIAAEVIPGTNIIVFGPNETFVSGQTLQAQYTTCSALLPPTVLTSNFLTLTQPETGEVIIAGGFTYPSVADPTISMDGSGPFARRYYLYLMPSGVLQAFPQILVPAQSVLTSISGTFTPVAASNISVGITNTTGSLSLDVEVVVTGTALSEVDGSTSTVSETLSFQAANGFADQVVPSTAYDLPGQILTTLNRFQTISSISATPTNAGSNPQIQVWAECEPGSTPEMNDAALIARLYWNGNAINKIEDMRVIRTGWVKDTAHLFASGEAELDSILMLNATKNSVTALTNPSVKLMTEDFEDLRYFDSIRGYLAPTSATGVIGLNSAVLLQAGDTIQLTSSKTLTAVAGTPAVPGQFSVGTTQSPIGISQTVSNLVAAINDTNFASGATASVSTSNPLNINVVLNTPTGIAANVITISATTATLGAVSVTGFSNAADGYGECYLDRSTKGLVSTQIPADSNLNPYQFAYRRRYRSRALALSAAIGPQQHFMIEIHGQNKSFVDSLRIRGALTTSPTIWQAWQLPTVVPTGTKGLYQVTFSAQVHKIQVEYYGRARGLSVYMTRP